MASKRRTHDKPTGGVAERSERDAADRTSARVKPGKTRAATKMKSAGAEPHLIMFHGTECPHCRNMDESVEQLEKEFKVKVAKLEVWHNDKNAQLLEMIDKGFCGGVPFFWNAKTKRHICGETDYDTLKDWALGK
ncbi:thioredoxin family protein [Candidatus Woesearchaeota archaeon]|nr:thioredoxin family protein [Candidatus Woesearchaeota archaeon]